MALLLAPLALAVALQQRPDSASSAPLVIDGGTVVDLSRRGTSTADLRDAVVVIEGGKITAVGKRGAVRVPAGARTIDARGGYIVPGYIDGFAAQASQAFANAYLYMGVTSIVAPTPPRPGAVPPGSADPRRAPTFDRADPSPRLFYVDVVLGAVRDSGAPPRPMSEAEARAAVDRLASEGVKIALLHYRLRPGPLAAAAARARELGLATYGELGFTPYTAAQDAGVDVFLHASRYALELAPAEMREAVARAPFGPPRLEYYRYLTSLSPDDSVVARHAARLGAGRTMLMPTLSLMYLTLPGHDNPWREPAARLLAPEDIHLPADPQTGVQAAPADSARDLMPAELGRSVLAFEERYRRAGARYLAGSATSAFGTMPGISLHTELALLVRVGLTPRQALAAATSNFSELAPWRTLGRVAPGYEADLLVLDADPTADIANARRVRAVILRGRPVDRAALLTAAAGK